jgi:hypothetical protein
MTFSEDLAAAKTVVREQIDVDVMLNGHLHTLRFTASDPDQWADVVDRNPPRPLVAIDEVGFNLRGVVKMLAPKVGELVVDGKPEKLRVDPVDPDSPKDPNRVDEWADLLRALSGYYIEKIGDAIYRLNRHHPAQAVEAAKKKLKRSALISSLQSDSE